VGGGLPAEDAADVRAHLEGCAACRAALAETRRAAEVFDAHLTSGTLAALAWDESPGEVPEDVARRHLAACPDCAEELALLQQSRDLERAPELPRAAAPKAPPAWMTWAAPLAAGVVIGLGLGMFRGPGAPPPASPDPLTSAELVRLRGDNAALRTQLQEAQAPEVNLPVAELFAADTSRGPGRSGDNEIVIPAGTRTVALLLAADVAGSREADIELRGRDGALLWSGSGLRPGAHGSYSVALPASLLGEGSSSVVLKPRGAREVRFALRVRRTGL
jgi:hypothetical protein